MIHVCDAIMGTGKSQSAITYMNEHKERRFIYITPYLDEAERIKKGCPALHFIEPSNKIYKYGNKKIEHTMALIKQGRNIASTHQLFRNYTPEMLQEIRDQHYTLLIDESVDILERIDIHDDDMQLLVSSGLVVNDGLDYKRTDVKYNGKIFQDIMNTMNCRELVKVDEDGSSYFYWVLSAELVTSFDDVIIMTYLFKSQSMYKFLEMYHLPYDYIGIEQTDSGNGFRFGAAPGYTPAYVSHLADMIEIIDRPKLNAIGEDYTALSMSWYESHPEEIAKLKNNMWNYFNCINKGIPVDYRLWGAYSTSKEKLKGQGYMKAFLSFNTKATNEYKDRYCLAYPVNIFMNVSEKLFFQSHGITVDEDIYALSIMVQWIWRSAIRDGSKIIIYIPSKRMRELLQNWIATVSSQGGDNYDYNAAAAS